MNISDYRRRVQRIFDTHNVPLMPSGKLLRDCFRNEVPPKSVYQLVKEIASGTPHWTPAGDRGAACLQ